jgi:hypothetical protein
VFLYFREHHWPRWGREFTKRCRRHGCWLQILECAWRSEPRSNNTGTGRECSLKQKKSEGNFKKARMMYTLGLLHCREVSLYRFLYRTMYTTKDCCRNLGQIVGTLYDLVPMYLLPHHGLHYKRRISISTTPKAGVLKKSPWGMAKSESTCSPRCIRYPKAHI